MIVLGFDTATPATAVALRLDDGTTLRARDDPGSGERPGHTTRLLPLARALLAQAALGWDAPGLIAVGVGPGTFTGLRVGVATARGLAQSLGIEVADVGTPQVLAQAALADLAARREPGAGHGALPPGARSDGVLAVIDARRGEAFVAAFARGAPRELAPRESALRQPAPREPTMPHELTAARALPPSELAGVAAAADPGLSWRAVGDGALRFRAELEAAGIAVPADDSPLHAVDAGVLCELALDAPHGAPEAVLPDYRRRPDAEIALENAQQ